MYLSTSESLTYRSRYSFSKTLFFLKDGHISLVISFVVLCSFVFAQPSHRGSPGANGKRASSLRYGIFLPSNYRQLLAINLRITANFLPVVLIMLYLLTSCIKIKLNLVVWTRVSKQIMLQLVEPNRKSMMLNCFLPVRTSYFIMKDAGFHWEE